MGFWDAVKHMGTAIVDDMKERQERFLQYRESFQHKDDQELYRIYKNSSYDIERKRAAYSLLQERGYGTQNDD